MLLVSMRVPIAYCEMRSSRTKPGKRGRPNLSPFKLWILLLLLAALVTSVIAVPQVMQRPFCTPAYEGGFLRTAHGELVNAACQQVQLTGVNWFGMETDAFAPHGLDVRNWQAMLDQMVRAGFNTIRFPFSNQFRSEEHTSELQSHSFISYAVF